MKKFILTVAVCGFVIFNGYSQTKQESIKELLLLMHQDSLIDKMFSNVTTSVMAMTKQMGNGKDSVLDKGSMDSTFITIKAITKKMMNVDMVAIYDKYFTQNEINDFIRFYKSPAGQKMIQLTPAIQKDLTMVMLQKYLPEIQSSFKKGDKK